MPNFVCAGFTVTGDPVELQRFKDRMVKPEHEVGMAAYFDIPSPPRKQYVDPATPEGGKLTLDFNGIIQMPPEEECPDWEGWAVEHWGTKWNAQSVDMRDERPDRFWFQFMTAWDFPTPVFAALAREFPALVFEGSAYEESGEFELAGQINGDNSWGPAVIDWGEEPDEEDEDDEGVPF